MAVKASVNRIDEYGDVVCGRLLYYSCCLCAFIVFCQAEDGIRDLVRSRGLGDVYKRQVDSQAS